LGYATNATQIRGIEQRTLTITGPPVMTSILFSARRRLQLTALFYRVFRH
jgi:hypothetical protein